MQTINFEGANGALDSGNGKVPIMFDEITKIVVTCWEPTPQELLELHKTRKLYICTQVKDGTNLQPTMPTTKLPR